MSQPARRRIIVLFGAGATASVGYPLMSDVSIYDQIKALPRDSSMLGEHEIDTVLRPLIQDIQHYLRRLRGQVTLEAVIDRALRYDQIVGEINHDDRLYGVFFANQETRNEAGPLRRSARDLYELSHKVLLRIYGMVPTNADAEAEKSLLRLLDVLRQENPSKKLSIYTTNYDTFWEHLRETHRGFRFDDRALRTNGRPDNAPFFLWRLHGCVRYCRTSRGDICYVNEVNKTKLEFNLPDGLGGSSGARKEEPLSKLMAIKVGEGGPDLAQDPFREAFASFERELNDDRKDTICVVIGFSFRDVSVSHRLCDALCRKGLNTRIVCIDPFISRRDIIDRLRQAAGYPVRPGNGRSDDMERRLEGRICVLTSAIEDVGVDRIMKVCQLRSTGHGPEA